MRQPRIPGLIVEALRQRAPAPVSYADLLREVWGPGYEDDAETRQMVRMHVSEARRRLPAGEAIVTHKGLGYALYVVRQDGTGA